jgi:hypothetical protein
VAKGTYYPSQDDNRDTSFCIPDSLQVYGGFCPDMGVDSFEERDWRTHVTILSGDIGTPGDSLDNSYRIVKTYNVSSYTEVDGFTIAYGAAIGDDIEDRFGAGWGNEASGAGMVSSPQLCNLRFICNSADFAGAGIFNVSNNGGKANPQIRNVEFRGNVAENVGAGISNFSQDPNSCSNPELFNCLFSGNFSNGSGAAISNEAVINGLAAPRIVNSTITGNRTFATNAILYNFTDLGGIIKPVFINTLAYGNSSGFPDPFNDAHFSQIQGIPGTGTNLEPDQDPLFVDSIDYNDAPTKAGDFRLRNCSPALDSGTVDSLDLINDLEDFFGNDRVAFESVDLGYYEIPDPLPGDSIFNIDCDPYCRTSDPLGDAVWIRRVAIYNLESGFSNFTGPEPGGYGNYTDLQVDPGDYPGLYFALQGQATSAFALIYWRVWIDYNMNDQFDPSELVIQQATNVPFNASVALPPWLQEDTPYRIRVSASQFGYADACGENPFSETEDYTLFIASDPDPCVDVLTIQDEDVIGTYRAGQRIVTQGDVEVMFDTQFQAREFEFGPGFEVPLGKSFVTKDQPCGN